MKKSSLYVILKKTLHRRNDMNEQTNTIVPYNGDAPYVFISYAHKDSSVVFPILRALQNEGLRFWYDAGIKLGSEWPAYIEEHLLPLHPG